MAIGNFPHFPCQRGVRTKQPNYSLPNNLRRLSLNSKSDLNNVFPTILIKISDKFGPDYRLSKNNFRMLFWVENKNSYDDFEFYTGSINISSCIIIIYGVFLP